MPHTGFPGSRRRVCAVKVKLTMRLAAARGAPATVRTLSAPALALSRALYGRRGDAPDQEEQGPRVPMCGRSDQARVQMPVNMSGMAFDEILDSCLQTGFKPTPKIRSGRVPECC
jgi:hypothetical protein